MHLPAITRARCPLALSLGYLAFCLLYLGSHALRLTVPTALHPGALDAMIPFIDTSIWLYLSQFILLPVAIVCAGDTRQRGHVFYAALWATMIAAVIFMLWPTQLTRPSVPDTGVTGLAWRLLFATDTDGNCFPSLHVALAALAGAALWRRGRRLTAILWPVLIGVATLTTKQHIVWDTLGGMILALLAWTLTPRLFRYD